MIAIIPALNEQDTIGELVTDLRGLGLSVVVVDDGSTDDTGAIAAQSGAKVVRHIKRLRIARSLLDGFRAATSDSSCRRFVTIDAGGSHNPNDLPALLAQKADLVIGSRFMDGARYIGTPRRALFSRIAANALNFAAGTKISDWTSGYRVYSRAAVDALVYQSYYATGHAFQIETLSRIVRQNRHLTVSEAPITYTAGRSTLRMNSVEQAFFLWLELFFS